MKTEYMTFAQAQEHKPKHPERSARRDIGGDNWGVAIGTWSTRQALVRAIRSLERTSTPLNKLWKPYVPLDPSEGY